MTYAGRTYKPYLGAFFSQGTYRYPSVALARNIYYGIVHMTYISLTSGLFFLKVYPSVRWPVMKINLYKLAAPAISSHSFLATICRANTDPPVTKIRLWASFGCTSWYITSALYR